MAIVQFTPDTPDTPEERMAQELGLRLLNLLQADSSKEKFTDDKEKEALDLIAAGASVNANNSGRTVLMYACERNSLPVVAALVNAGADVSAVYIEEYWRPDFGHRGSRRGERRYSTADFASYAENRAIHYLIQSKLYPTTHDWMPYDENSVAEVVENKVLNNKLIHIFNFATREKMTVVENTKSNSTGMSPVTHFDDIDQTRLREAFDAYRVFRPDMDEAVLHCNAIKPFTSKFDKGAG